MKTLALAAAITLVLPVGLGQDQMLHTVFATRSTASVDNLRTAQRPPASFGYSARPMDNLQTVVPRIERLDRRLDELLPPDARVERIVHGFSWLEGPLWLDSKQILLFSDIPGNVIRSWSAQAGTHVFLEKSGYTGETPFPGREPGSNGLALDRDGRLLIAEHGNRRITRLEADGSRTVLVDDYRGKRLNSPNDLTVAADGSIYFTDPPFGLPETFDDPGKELSFSGVFRRSPEGELTLLTDQIRAPNGIAFSPDGRTLYVSNAEHSNPVWYAFRVNDDGTLGERRTFQDATRFVTQYQGVPDGMKVDGGGNVFGSGPGGVYIFAPDGTHLGTIVIGGATSNVAFGSGYLFITAGEAVYRVGLR